MDEIDRTSKEKVDDRFNFASDPRFKKLPKRLTKFQPDSRFKKYTSTLDDEDEKDFDVADDELDDPTAGLGVNVDEDEAKVHVPDYIRGEGLVSSSEESDDEDEGIEEQEVKDVIGMMQRELEKDVEFNPNTTRRIAICNMDWDNVSATDLFVLASSFAPATGRIESVTIYPSEFGFEKMALEEKHGPGAIMKEFPKGLDEQERLRAYQLLRLKYYYAVVVCDSVGTASSIYEGCDGLEYQKSGCVVDVRYIPDEVSFEDDTVKDAATKLPSHESYEPSDFTTKAWQQSNVELTWDQDDRQRFKATRRKFTKDDIKRMDLESYIASEESSEEESEQVNISAFRNLVDSIKESRDNAAPEEEMQISFNTGLRDAAEKLVKAKQEKKETENLTVGEKYRLKKKNEKKSRKGTKEEVEDEGDETDEEREDTEKEEAALAMLLDDDADQKNEEFEVDVEDDRFKEMYESHEYNLDPTNPRFKKTKNMERIMEKKRQRHSEKLGSDHETKQYKRKSSQKLSKLKKSMKRRKKGK